MISRSWRYFVLVFGLVSLAHPVLAAAPYAYAANAGWVNFAPDTTAAPVRVGPTFLAGYAYAANFGWIDCGDGTPANGTPANGTAYSNNSAGDFGVNHDGTGRLSGFAYCANVGWINFGWADGSDPNRPRIDLVTGEAVGFAYGANVGWINLASLQFSFVLPAIITQPVSQSVGMGSSVTFTAVSSGDPMPTYQWQKNGVAISGATGSSYTITSVAEGDAGNYTVLVTNSVGTATSNQVTLATFVAAPSNAIITFTVE